MTYILLLGKGYPFGEEADEFVCAAVSLLPSATLSPGGQNQVIPGVIASAVEF